MEKERIKIKEPIRVIPSDNYKLVIEDADKTRHYWLPDGSYDGHDQLCEDCDNKTYEEEELIRKIITDARLNRELEKDSENSNEKKNKKEMIDNKGFSYKEDDLDFVDSDGMIGGLCENLALLFVDKMFDTVTDDFVVNGKKYNFDFRVREK